MATSAGSAILSGCRSRSSSCIRISSAVSRISASRVRRRSRPTPFRPALDGRDVLACAMTGSGKTVAFLLPILHRLIGRPRGTTRALVLTPTRELAAQILEDLNDLAVHTPITAAAVFGGVGMGPQEHAFRSGVDVIVATPGRLLDHFRQPYARLAGIEFLVLDEADRMLDMGFLPDIRRVLRHLPTKRQTLFFSATMPPPIAELTREMLHDPVTINLERRAAPASGITQAVYPVAQQLKSALLLAAARVGRRARRARLHADEASRESAGALPVGKAASASSASTATARRRSAPRRSQVSRAAATACSSRPTSPRAASTSTALGHVINFDVPAAAGRLHPPRRPDRARRADRRRPSRSSRRTRRAICARSSGPSTGACRASPCPTSTTPPGAASNSKCRTRSASPRSAHARPTNAPGPRPRPNGAPRAGSPPPVMARVSRHRRAAVAAPGTAVQASPAGREAIAATADVTECAD